MNIQMNVPKLWRKNVREGIQNDARQYFRFFGIDTDAELGRYFRPYKF
jgi:hypothetical protein